MPATRAGAPALGPEPRSSHASAPDGRLRVLVVDDHAVVRHGLTMLLAEAPDLQVVGEAQDGAEAVALALQLRPDVVLMDFSMPELNGVEATRAITAQLPGVRVIGLSMYQEADRATAMLEAGAESYLSKSDAHEHLIARVRGDRGAAAEPGPAEVRCGAPSL